jgi:predicted Zn-dependent protease
VPLALADSYAGIAAWPRLEELTATAKWTEFDFLRWAFLTRAYRGEDKLVKAEATWANARKEASQSSQKLLALTEMLSDWGWDKEADELLWELAKQPEARFEALHTLYRRYSRSGNSPGLYHVLEHLVELEPNDLTIQNNYAQVSLLLKFDLPRACRIAGELHGREPGNAAMTATYAFSLFRQNKVPQAVAVMNSLTPAQLDDPSISLYYGIFLAANQERDRAKGVLTIAKESRMFPEERELFEMALKQSDTRAR